MRCTPTAGIRLKDLALLEEGVRIWGEMESHDSVTISCKFASGPYNCEDVLPARVDRSGDRHRHGECGRYGHRGERGPHAQIPKIGFVWGRPVFFASPTSRLEIPGFPGETTALLHLAIPGSRTS